MPRITQASIGKITLEAVSSKDVSAVAEGSDDIKKYISSVEWNNEIGRNDNSPVGTGPREYTEGKKASTVTLNGFPSPAGDFVGSYTDAEGVINTGDFALYMEYGGDSSDDRQLQAIITLNTVREALDAEGNAIVETAWLSNGDDLPLAKAH